jgi:hypothetical protein
VHGDICTVCCGIERERTIDCPLECIYLRDAHEHERPPELDPSTLPNQDIQITEEFLRENEVLMAFLAIAVFEEAVRPPVATDWDVREALEALIQGYRTLQAGLYYESVPTNVYAASIAAHVRSKVAEIREKEIEAGGTPTIRDSAILAVLAFLQRLEYAHNNGRQRSRAFLDFLRGFYIPTEESDENVLEPDAPRIIL